jgi:hypothetical protein
MRGSLADAATFDVLQPFVHAGVFSQTIEGRPRMGRSVRTLVWCLAILLGASASAAAKAKKPHHVPSWCHSQDCRSATAPRPDPELGIHGYFGGGGFGGFVGRQGQAGYNW